MLTSNRRKAKNPFGKLNITWPKLIVFAVAAGATLAASRPVVDAGWLPYSCQVGQTGTTVQPDIYVAVGVSGAIQHWVGMGNAKKIIAVNKDPDCFMMQQADVAVQADLFSLLPAAISKLQK